MADRIKGRLKEAIIGLLSLAVIIFTFLSLISVGVFSFGRILYVQILVYILLISGNEKFLLCTFLILHFVQEPA